MLIQTLRDGHLRPTPALLKIKGVNERQAPSIDSSQFGKEDAIFHLHSLLRVESTEGERTQVMSTQSK